MEGFLVFLSKVIPPTGSWSLTTDSSSSSSSRSADGEGSRSRGSSSSSGRFGCVFKVL
jgi:hypothetical protein